MGEMHYEPLLRIQFPHRVQSFDKIIRRADSLDGLLAYPCHDVHAYDHIDRIGDLNAGPRIWRIRVAHHVGNHVERAPPHATIEKPREHSSCFRRLHPVVVGPGILFLGEADVSELFRSGDVRWMAPVEIGLRKRLWIEFPKGPVRASHLGLYPQLDEPRYFLPVATNPTHVVRLGQSRLLFNPAFNSIDHDPDPPCCGLASISQRNGPKSPTPLCKRGGKGGFSW